MHQRQRRYAFDAGEASDLHIHSRTANDGGLAAFSQDRHTPFFYLSSCPPSLLDPSDTDQKICSHIWHRDSEVLAGFALHRLPARPSTHRRPPAGRTCARETILYLPLPSLSITEFSAASSTARVPTALRYHDQPRGRQRGACKRSIGGHRGHRFINRIPSPARDHFIGYYGATRASASSENGRPRGGSQ